MDKTCSIVQDLLPLYEEDMLREETKEFVDGHLAQLFSPYTRHMKTSSPYCWPSRSR